MTTPVEVDDIVQGAVKYLQAQPAVRAVLGGYEGTDVAWLFQHKMWVDVEGTSSTAAMIGRDGGWAGANLHNTMRFPMLTMEIWADPIRDDGKNVVDPGEVYRRIEATFAVLDSFLHRPQGGEQRWGTVRTVSCVRMTEPTIYEVPDGDGLLRLLTSYAVAQG